MVGLGGFEPPTSPLSGVRSNQLSYRPEHLSSWVCSSQLSDIQKRLFPDPCAYRLSSRLVWTLASAVFSLKGGDPAAGSPTATLLRLHPSH